MPVAQLGLLVLDASGSMGELVAATPDGQPLPPNTTKQWLVEEMLARPLRATQQDAEDWRSVLDDCGLVARMQNSANKRMTELGIIRFDEEPEPYWEVRPVLEWELSPVGTRLDPPQVRDPHQRNAGEGYRLGPTELDLLANRGGGTDIAAGLRYADQVAKAWVSHMSTQFPNTDPLVSIVLMSDMLEVMGDPQQVLEVANQIKTNQELGGRPQILLCAAAFGEGTKVNLPFMQQLATPDPDNKWSMHTTDPTDLRRFFLKSLGLG